jgi:hypothetical protein
MKYGIPIRPHGARSPHPRSRVPAYMPTTHPSSPYPFIRPSRQPGLTDSTHILARRQPFHLPLHSPTGQRNPIQNP